MTEYTKITKEEAGRKGGNVRAEKYNKEELSKQAKQAANTVEERHSGFHSEIGQKGGQIRAGKYTSEELSKQAKKSAETIEKRHPGFHSEIGKKGGIGVLGGPDDEERYEDDEERIE